MQRNLTRWRFKWFLNLMLAYLTANFSMVGATRPFTQTAVRTSTYRTRSFFNDTITASTFPAKRRFESYKWANTNIRFIVRENVRDTAKKRKKSQLFGFRKKRKQRKNVEVITYRLIGLKIAVTIPQSILLSFAQYQSQYILIKKWTIPI